MNTLLKIKNGAIALPKDLARQWKDEEVRIKEDIHGRIILEPVNLQNHKLMIRDTLSLLQKTAGILQGRIKNPVAWQRKIRKECGRKLPKFHVYP